jgi:hypothetical protein
MLPPGIHRATLDEVIAAFGWNPHRLRLLAGLVRAIAALSAAGCTVLWLDGSFVTTKDDPGDFDATWSLDGVDFAALDPVILDTDPPRLAQKLRFSGDLLPNVVEGSSGMPFLDFFQEDKHTGEPRGIVEIQIGASS